MDISKIKKNLVQFIIVNCFVSLLIFIFGSFPKTALNFLINFLISGMYSFFIGFGNFFLNEWLNSKFSWENQPTKRLVWGVIGTLFVNIFMVYACNYTNFVIFQGLKHELFFTQKFNFINWFFINLSIMISAILHAIGFFKANKIKNQKQLELQNQIANNANAQFASLKNQLDPHFLFNSLNVLTALIDENPKLAQKFTIDMSKIYRYVLEQKDKKMVSVTDEIKFAYIYCDLLKIRFDDALNISFDLKETDLQKQVVPLSLQLLLENAIKHNFASSQKQLEIKIFSENSFLIVENNLQKREITNSGIGIGLENINSRYQLLTDEKVLIENTAEYFRVKLPLLEN